jgi:hypothetical protein
MVRKIKTNQATTQYIMKKMELKEIKHNRLTQLERAQLAEIFGGGDPIPLPAPNVPPPVIIVSGGSAPNGNLPGGSS